jgi:site-specific DNA-cytosine methylase
MTAYYNEIDPYAADWLRNLIKEGLIAYGEVDTRSIVDVRSSDLVAFEQCHFFAGLGGWSGALRLAGVSDVEPLWTGSCPCQPFSLAGKQKGFDDERHLWPIWRELIRERRPAKVFGEQVASASAWLGLVRGDLEAMGYAVGAIPVEAASAGADHLRDRYWFVADGQSFDRRRGPEHSEPAELWISKLGHASSTWATPNTVDAKGGNRLGTGQIQLCHQAKQVWPTPTAQQYGSNQGGAAGRVGPVRGSIATIAKAVWPTAKRSDDRSGMPDRFQGPMSDNGRRSNLNDAAAMQNRASNGSSAPTEKPGALNPEFVCWLMGYPPEWLSCAPSAMPSTSGRRRRS